MTNPAIFKAYDTRGVYGVDLDDETAYPVGYAYGQMRRRELHLDRPLQIVVGADMRLSLQLNPVIPGNWEGFHLRYPPGETIHETQVENPKGLGRGAARVELDGQRLKEGLIPLERGLVKHRVVVCMGKPEMA
jgi:hypothetical protein